MDNNCDKNGISGSTKVYSENFKALSIETFNIFAFDFFSVSEERAILLVLKMSHI